MTTFKSKTAVFAIAGILAAAPFAAFAEPDAAQSLANQTITESHTTGPHDNGILSGMNTGTYDQLDVPGSYATIDAAKIPAENLFNMAVYAANGARYTVDGLTRSADGAVQGIIVNAAGAPRIIDLAQVSVTDGSNNFPVLRTNQTSQDLEHAPVAPSVAEG